MVLMIDNYDSFTYNLVQYLKELGARVRVVRNDELTARELVALRPDRVIISPGPCTPNEAGVSLDAIGAFAGRVPVLGVCLGHQAIGQVYGGHVVGAREVMHGKVSDVYHNQLGIFTGLPSPFPATRYHSLVLDRARLPEELELTAWTQAPDGSFGEVMGIRHRQQAVEGVQFHPESILSEQGHRLLQNFLQQTPRTNQCVRRAGNGAF